ncbi:MAG: signal peptidase I [Corallococcus sp.]|nr:signal peptidase I [Corallococcus sp.]MCM1359018.1 signal peptidase I [Corallococcus sp.]MCM1395007.1 signal peptidase I [Corallococcus sp.]
MENKDDHKQNNLHADESSQDFDTGEKATSGGTAAQNRKRKISKILTVLLVVAIVVFVGCLLLKWFWVSNIGVSGISMMPNYENGDVVWVNKAVTPKRGDVIVFYVKSVNKFLGEFATGADAKSGGQYEKYIKRVVAVGGDSIWWEKVDDKRCVLVIKTADGKIIRENEGDNVYYRHGKQAQFYTESGGELSTVPYFQIPLNDKNNLYAHDSEETAFTVKEDHVFVMGDNRYASEDSRSSKLGTVWLDKLYGVVINP